MKRITTTILTALLGLGVALPAMAAPSINKGDTAWMFVATLLVILMTIPGLALFYGGLVRAKNMLSVLMQVMMVFALVIVLWCLYGYSLAFTQGNAFIGGLVTRVLVRIELDGETVTKEERLLGGLNERIRDVREGPDGAIYLLTDNAAGRILRLTPAK